MLKTVRNQLQSLRSAILFSYTTFSIYRIIDNFCDTDKVHIGSSIKNIQWWHLKYAKSTLAGRALQLNDLQTDGAAWAICPCLKHCADQSTQPIPPCSELRICQPLYEGINRPFLIRSSLLSKNCTLVYS